MAEKLGLGPEVRELKIGDSFLSNKIAFHTLRYDFKPASVVTASKHAIIEVGSNQQITVTHMESGAAPQTVFKGSQKPYHKECVLIIDRTTGEITLEKLSTNIQLKKTRQEQQRSAFNSVNSRPPTPVEKKPSPPQSKHKSSSRSLSNHSVRQSPLNSSPSYPHRSPHMLHKSPPQVHITSMSPSPAASLPMIEDINENSSSSFDISNTLNLPEIKTSPDFSGMNLNEESLEVGILSDSSSDSSSDSGSSDSDSEHENTPIPPAKPMNGHVNGKSSPLIPERLLNEDLQLSSESGSDSD